MIVQGGAQETTVYGKRHRVVSDKLLIKLQAGEDTGAMALMPRDGEMARLAERQSWVDAACLEVTSIR